MAVLDHVGVDHLVSKISEKISNVEGLTNEAYDLAGEANSMATTANDKAEEALKKNNNIEIWYTTSDGLVLTQGDNDTYENGRGVLVVNPSATTLFVGTLGLANRSRLTSLALPCNHFQSIGILTASAITGFTCFEVPDSVKTIVPGAFSNSKFTEIKLGSGLKTIGNGAFSNSSALETIDIPDSVTEINAVTFAGCTSLKTVKLSSSLEVIYESAFSGCTSLETIDIPDSVTEIGRTAFDACTSLKTIKIGSGITSIKNYAFRLSSGVTKCEIHSITPPSLGSVVFNVNADFKIYVPIESVDAYKQAVNWSAYADRIVGVVFEDENLISGENIKTINGQSLLGSGNIETPQPVYPYYLPVTMSEINNSLGNNSSGQIEYDYDTYYEEIKGAILSEREIRIDNDDVTEGGFYISIDSEVDDYIYITFASLEFIFTLSFEEGYVYVNRTEMANGHYVKSNFLPLSGGTMNGNLVTKQINVEAGNWVITNGTGLMMQRSDGPSYIWNKTTGHSISIGTNAVGSTSELNASLNIKGNDVYPGPNGTINLGIDAHTFNNIKGNSIHGKKFIGGNYNRSDFINSLTAGLQISTNIQKSDNNTAGDYGFPASNNANGVLSFRVHNGNSSSLSDYCHYLGFSQKGLFYRNNNATSDNWVKLNNPSIFQPSVPLLSEYTDAASMIPEIIHDNITNVFHDIQQTNILVERSQDGTTWVDTTETDFPKFRQVMSTGKAPNNVPVVAYDGANGQVGDRVRITINGACAYAKLAYIYVYYTTIGATTKLTIEKNTYSAQDTWVTIVDKEKVTGWSGPNYYGLENSNIGQTNGNNGYSYRLTFEITAITSGQTNVGQLNNIWAISSDRPWSITNDPNKMFYFNVGRWKHVTNKSIEPLYDVTGALGSSNYRWSSVYAKDFYGTNFYGTSQKATMDASGRNIADTYALASTCYGGPEGKIAVGTSDNLIGKALTNSWGIYNGRHDIIISEYDSSTETWVEKFNSTSLTSGSANYNAFVKGMTGSFYTSTRGSKVKMTVTANAGSVYVQAISLYLKSKDTTYSGNIDYTYSTNSGNIEYSGTLGTWGSWCPITMSLTYRTSFEIIFNENEANAQLLINGFRIVTQADGVVPILIGKSHESYKADTAAIADKANRATIATQSAMVGDGTIQLYAQSGNEINFGGTNTTNPTIIFGYRSADGNQIVPTQYKFGNDATASVYASKFITTGGVSSQFVKGDGSLDSTKYVTEEQLIEVEEVTAAALTDLAENKVDTSELSNYMPKTGGTFTDTVYGTTFDGTLVGAIYNATW